MIYFTNQSTVRRSGLIVRITAGVLIIAFGSVLITASAFGRGVHTTYTSGGKIIVRS